MYSVHLYGGAFQKSWLAQMLKSAIPLSATALREVTRPTWLSHK
ncbi:hypothetical protein FOPG_20092, partial [Fusarium oxysporum f. sp. conglutinans race 2 54008]